MKFDYHRPFTAYVANTFRGKHVHIITRDSGLQGSYEGIVEPINDHTTRVGEDIILNECVHMMKVKGDR